MELFIELLQFLLPILVTLALGYLCCRMQLIPKEAIAGIKKLITHILLPVVIFNALSTIYYSLDLLVIFLTLFIGTGVQLLFGFFGAKKALGEYGTFTPFLIAGSEVGMLGYALFALLAGQQNIHYMASLDLGNGLFLNLISLGLLSVASGEKMSIKQTAMTILKQPTFIGTILGVIVGASGLAAALHQSAVSGIYTSLVGFLTAPISVLVLFSVGYECKMHVSILKPALKVIGLRIVASGIMLFLAYRVIFSFLSYDPTLAMALVLFFALPASMIVPMFTKSDADNQYTSTTLSLYLIVTMVVFAILIYKQLTVAA